MLGARPLLAARSPLLLPSVQQTSPLLSQHRSLSSSVNRIHRNVTKKNRLILSVTPGTMPHATTKSYKPTSPGRRHRVVIDRSHIWPLGPVKELTMRIAGHSQSGRNNTGRITVRGRKAPKHRRKYRIIDFHRKRTDPAIVKRFEYDPNRSPFIALIEYISDKKLSYILAPHDLAVGATVQAGEEAPYAPGNAMELRLIPEGAEVHNIEIRPGMGGSMVRSAGMAARLLSKDDKYVTLKLPSGEMRKVLGRCMATIGQVSNEQWWNRVLGKAGASNWVGRRPQVRGVAMNPVDHPMGGGEGRSSGGRPSCSPWGWYTKGIRTRNNRKMGMMNSSKLILRRRNHDKLKLGTKPRPRSRGGFLGGW